jgi:hypothetical protein
MLHGSFTPLDTHSIHWSKAFHTILKDGPRTAQDLLSLLAGYVTADIRTEIGASEIKAPSASEISAPGVDDAYLLWSLLYYHGIITHGETTGILCPTNLTAQRLVRIVFVNPSIFDC